MKSPSILRGALAVPVAALDLLLELALEAPAVEQPCEVVVLGQRHELLLHPLAARDVLDLADEVLGHAIRVVDQRDRYVHPCLVAALLKKRFAIA